MIARLRDLPEAARAESLEQACRADPSLRERVPALLAAVGSTSRHHATPAGSVNAGRFSSFGRQHVIQAFTSALTSDGAESPGTQIGHYKLLQKVGEGGFGTVWMAEQQEPIRRRVAVKIIKLGMDTHEVIARFEAERQALALMDHPNIARVIDAGATETGRPYFVMELVRGVAITRYCNDNRLPAEARLRLFMDVCGAVQHAHQKGVIHRDLKPSNILVTLHDGLAVPKVIDFGIAKATNGAQLTEKTLFTQFHAFIGTPAYTSPEQIEMSGLDVDTRSDIYSLGVLLYELLAGYPPFDSDALMKSGLEAMRHTIREVDPPRPSHRLITLPDAERTSVAQQRSTEPGNLSLLLRGDLDWIVMRCLEKDRVRRYETANGLARDIQRHLESEPVSARPPSGAYRLRKFVRRHKLGVAAASAVAFSVVAGLIASSVLLVRERTAHARASLAEQKETDLRRQTEAARVEEVKRAARTALDLANRHLADGHIAEGLAYLVYAARKDPTNPTLAPRLASVLASHNFLLPQGEPFACGSPVLDLRYAHDGRTVLCGTEDGTFRAIDAASGELRCEVRLRRPVNPGSWVFADDNDTVVGVRFPDNTFGVYGLPSGQPKFPLLQLEPRTWPTLGHMGLGHPLALSPDGRWLYALAPQQFWLWDATTGQLRLSPTFAEGIFGASFSADSSRLALTVGNAVQQWALPDCTKVATSMVFRPDVVRNVIDFANVRYSPDGRFLAVCGFPACQVFDAVTGARLQELANNVSLGGYFMPGSLAFADASHVFAHEILQSISWDWRSGQSITLPIPAGNNLHAVDFDATGRRGMVASSDGLIRIFDLRTGTLVAEPAWPQHAGFCAALSPDGTQAIIGTAAGTIHRLRIGGGPARPLVLPRSLTPRMPAPFLPGSPARVLYLTGERAKVIEVSSGAEVGGGFVYPEPILEALDHDRHPPVRADLKFMVVQTQRGEWQSWELGRDGIKRVVALQDPPPRPGSINFSPAEDLVAIASDRHLRVWNLRTGLPAGPDFTYPWSIIDVTVNFSPDGKHLALGTSDGAALVLDVATSLPVATFRTRPLVPNSAVSFSPDGTRLVTINVRNEMILWNTVTHEPISPAVHVIGSGDAARFSGDGRWLVNWNETRASVWDGRTGAPVGQAIPAGGLRVSFSPDGNRVATAGWAGNAQVWDLPEGEPVTEPLSHHPLPAFNPVFSPEGRFLETENPNLYLWSIPPRPGTPAAPPEWLLRLATVCSTQLVNDAGQLTDASEELHGMSALRREIAALPADVPYAAWASWVLDERADRPIAPGFTITPSEADRLAAGTAGAK